MLKTYTNLNNNDNNNLPVKHAAFDKREVTFDKRYTEGVKSYDGKPLEIKTYDKPLALPLHSPYAGIAAGKSYHGLEEPIKLVKPLKRTNSHNDDEEDDDEDDHLLVIAHRENGAHEDESDHESSERSDRADDSA